MKHHPLLMKGPLVRATLEGRKTTGLLTVELVQAALANGTRTRRLYQSGGASPLDPAHVAARIINGIERIDDRGCWIWGRTRHRSGYGGMTISGRTVHVMRVSLAIDIGCDWNSLDEVCHECDNPPCVNPFHLFEGTHGDNVRDAVMKGRLVPRGAKLTEGDVITIRSALEKGAPGIEVARAHGISKSTVSMIKLRQSWAHV